MRLSKYISASKILQYVKNAGLYFGSSLIIAIINIVINPLLAANLSPTDYAIMGYYMSFNNLLTPLLHFCLITYYSRQYYFTPIEQREDLGNTLLHTINIIGIIILIIFTISLYGVHSIGESTLPFSPYAILTFAQLYFANITTFYLTKLRIERKAQKYAIVNIVQCVLSQGLVLFLVVKCSGGALGKLGASLLVTMLFAVYSYRHAVTSNKINKQLQRSAVRFCVPLVLSGCLWYFLVGIDRYFLGELGDTDMLGVYNVGVQITGFMTIFYTTLSNTFEPDIFQSIAENKRKKLFAIFAIIIGVVLVANLLFAILAPKIIGLLTANRYIAASPFVRILSIHNIIMALYYMLVKLMIGWGYVKQELYLRLLGAIISIFSYKLLIDKWQFYGAAVGQIVSFGVLCIIVGAYLWTKRKGDDAKNISGE